MAGTIVNNGDGTFTVSFIYTAPQDKLEATAGNCAEWLYLAQPSLYGCYETNGALTPFENLNNQQKVDILNKFILMNIKELAGRNRVEAVARTMVDDGTIDLGE